MEQSRREFIRDIGCASTLLLAGAWPKVLLAKSEKKFWETGASPLVFNNSSFSTTAVITSSVGQNIKRNSSVVLHSFRPDGKLIWKKEVKLQPKKTIRVRLPDGWSSMVALSETNEDKISPNVELTSFMSFKSPMGVDGFHCTKVSKNDYTAHIIPAPQKDEQVFVGFQNPTGKIIQGKITFARQDGSTEREEKIIWQPFQTHYAIWGESVLEAPPGAMQLTSKEKGLLAHIKNESQISIVPTAWIFNRNGSFSSSHGWVDELPAEAKSTQYSAQLNLENKNYSSLLNEDKYWYPGDILCLGAAPLSKQSYSSQIAVPNLTSEKISVAAIVYGENGEAIDLGGKKSISATIPAKGFGLLDFSEFAKLGKFGTVLCNTGQNIPIASLTKIWTRSPSSFFIQHLRPQENYIKDYMKKLNLVDANGFITDYWTSAEMENDSTHVLIRNMGSQASDPAEIVLNNSLGEVKKISIPSIASGGFQILSLTNEKELNSLRLLSKSSYLTLMYLNANKELKSVVHGVKRIREEAVWEKLPKYFS